MSARQALFLAGCICLAAGCKMAQPNGQIQIGLLDQQFCRLNVQERVREAERDLPGDRWETAIAGAKKSSGTWNQTRRDREANLAEELLNNLQPILSEDSVAELLACLKTYPQDSDLVLTGVASYYYDRGNQRVIEELRKRPKRELSCLRHHLSDNREIYQENGPYSSVRMLCQVILDQAAGLAARRE
jgi:hypothetical protein